MHKYKDVYIPVINDSQITKTRNMTNLNPRRQHRNIMAICFSFTVSPTADIV